MAVLRRGVAIALLLCLCAAHRALGAERYDPRLRFRTLSTRNFIIHYHQNEEPLAQRLAAIVEEIAARVAGQLGRANGRVHVILIDQHDLSNGWANPIPYNVIEITASAPPGSSVIGNTDDWLRLVFAHEYTHIVHLDKARGWVGGLRKVFGRTPLLYPNTFLPLWQIEGVATWNESALTGEGRVPAGDFRVIVDRAAATRRFEPLNRVNGGLVDWPAGTAQYAYGAYFHEYLARRFGAASVARLAEETAGRVPYFGARSFRKVFGRSLGDLWNDFSADAARRPGEQPPARTQLTHHGFTVAAPAFARSGRLFYSIVNPHGFPALMELRRDGSPPRRVADRFLGDRLSASGSVLVFDQIDLESNVSLRSDLFAIDQEGGRVRRLTLNARAADPDVSPDGKTIACTMQLAGGRALALLPLTHDRNVGVPTPLVAEDGTDFNAPRWSPDSRWIAAERRRLHGPSEIVIVDVASHAVRSIVASRDARNVTPSWMPDGRSILFASDRGGEPFAIYSVAVADGTVRRLENARGGAQSPVVSPDGRELVFIGYAPAGYDLFAASLATATWRDVPSSPEPARVPAASNTPVAASAPYRPWDTVLPRFWEPIVESTDGELSAGAATAGADALGRHAYATAITWATSRARPDWSFSYAYDRWQPTLFASFSDDTDPWRDGEVRTRELTAGALLTHRRVRDVWSTLVAMHASTDEFTCGSCQQPVAETTKRRALHVGWRFDNSRAYGYSISRETGAAVRATIESAPEAFGSDATTSAIAGDIRGYVHAGTRHSVLAFRLAGASSAGGRGRRVFSASGAGPQSDGFDIGTDAIGLLRGFESSSLIGEHATAVNVDYRFPIVYVQRGIGTLPFFLRSIHGAMFVDAANAWTSTFRTADLRRSFGAELSADTIVGYALPVTIASGIAWRHDPGGEHGGVVGFARIGRAF